MTPEEAARFARDHGCMYQECSARTDENVYDALVWGVVAAIIDTPTLLRSYNHPTLQLEQPPARSGSRPGPHLAMCGCQL